MNNMDQYISFYIDGHDSNISFYRPFDNKLLSLELERVWGQRYFRYKEDCRRLWISFCF